MRLDLRTHCQRHLTKAIMGRRKANTQKNVDDKYPKLGIYGVLVFIFQ